MSAGPTGLNAAGVNANKCVCGGVNHSLVISEFLSQFSSIIYLFQDFFHFSRV